MTGWEIAAGDLERATARLLGAAALPPAAPTAHAEASEALELRQLALDQLPTLSPQEATPEILGRLRAALHAGEEIASRLLASRNLTGQLLIHAGRMLETLGGEPAPHGVDSLG